MPSSLQFLSLLLSTVIANRQSKLLHYVLAENRVLRARLGASELRFNDAERMALGRAGKAIGRKLLAEIATLAHPETILRWYRRLVAKKYTGERRGPRAPRLAEATVHLLVMAQDNPSWAYTRLRGALYALGFEMSRTTIARVLADRGIEPAPTRKDAHPWRTFLKAHLGAIAAADFFTVEVLTLRGLVRYFVWFTNDLKTRAVTVALVSAAPSGEVMVNTARRLVDDVDGALRGMKYLIVDRDPLYTRDFREMLQRGGVELVRLPARSPNLNAYAERFVRSIKSELLSKVVPLGEGHLRHLLREYVEHYRHERPHQGVGNLILMPRGQPPWEAKGKVKTRQRVGGMFNFYERRAA